MTIQKNKWVKQQQPKAHRSWVENPMTSLKDMCLLSHFSSIWLFVTLWTIAQAPLSMGFSRQEYWSGLPWPPSGDLRDQGMEPSSLMSSAQASRFFTTSATWEAHQSRCRAFYSDIQSQPMKLMMQMMIIWGIIHFKWKYGFIIYVSVYIYVFICRHISVIKMNTYLLFIMCEALTSLYILLTPNNLQSSYYYYPDFID